MIVNTNLTEPVALLHKLEFAGCRVESHEKKQTKREGNQGCEQGHMLGVIVHVLLFAIDPEYNQKGTNER